MDTNNHFFVNSHIPVHFPSASVAVTAKSSLGGVAQSSAGLESKEEVVSALGPAGLVGVGGQAMGGSSPAPVSGSVWQNHRPLGGGYLGYAWTFYCPSCLPFPGAAWSALSRQWVLLSENSM